MELVEIGRISSKHVRVTVASPKGAQTPRSVGSTPPITGILSTTTMNNHVSAPTDEMAKILTGKEEPATDHVEEMDTREGALMFTQPTFGGLRFSTDCLTYNYTRFITHLEV